MGGWTLWMVDTYFRNKAIKASGWNVDQDRNPKEDESHLRKRVPCQQTCLYMSAQWLGNQGMYQTYPAYLLMISFSRWEAYHSIFTDPSSGRVKKLIINTEWSKVQPLELRCLFHLIWPAIQFSYHL